MEVLFQICLKIIDSFIFKKKLYMIIRSKNKVDCDKIELRNNMKPGKLNVAACCGKISIFYVNNICYLVKPSLSIKFNHNSRYLFKLQNFKIYKKKIDIIKPEEL